MTSKGKIEAILRERELSKGYLAERLGVSPQSLSRMLKHQHSGALIKIAEVLGVEYESLVSDEPIAEPQSQPILNGYVECRGRIFKITSKEDLYEVIASYDGYTLNKQ